MPLFSVLVWKIMRALMANFKEKTLLPDQETDQVVIQTEDIGSHTENQIRVVMLQTRIQIYVTNSCPLLWPFKTSLQAHIYLMLLPPLAGILIAAPEEDDHRKKQSCCHLEGC